MLGSINIVDLICICCPDLSHSKGKRLIRAGAIEWQQKKIEDINFEVILNFKED